MNIEQKITNKTKKTPTIIEVATTRETLNFLIKIFTNGFNKCAIAIDKIKGVMNKRIL